jgi:hypothetical protein
MADRLEWSIDGIGLQLDAAAIERDYLMAVDAHENVVQKVRTRELLIARSLLAPRGDLRRRNSGIATNEKAIEVAADVYQKLVAQLQGQVPGIRTWINDGLMRLRPGDHVWINAMPVGDSGGYVLRRLKVLDCSLQVATAAGGTLLLHLPNAKATAGASALLPAETAVVRWQLPPPVGDRRPIPNVLASPYGDAREKHIIQTLALPIPVIFIP